MARPFKPTAARPAPAAKMTGGTKDQERTRLAGSGLVQRFVKDKNGAWNHQDWLGFLAGVRQAGYRLLSDQEVGQVLEDGKVRFCAAKR